MWEVTGSGPARGNTEHARHDRLAAGHHLHVRHPATPRRRRGLPLGSGRLRRDHQTAPPATDRDQHRGSGGRAGRKQYGQDDGPCLQALRTARPVHAPDTLEEDRWGSYPAFAADLGIRSSLSLPIPVRTHTAGALNFYAAEPHAFSEDDRHTPTLFAAQAGGGIALAQRLADSADFTHDLQTALSSRRLIDQAIGSVMQRQRCTEEEAFDVLCRLSQHSNLKLRDVCTRLLTELAGQPPTTRPPLRPRS
ncbi:ANTAR domain-containing protein [Streptomyces collinus]|uniref:GAF and ANTAR domain-containing protein n=1 Tax=Streptomyces collinus TaxID=42684 RepID=UPI0036E94288